MHPVYTEIKQALSGFYPETEAAAMARWILTDLFHFGTLDLYAGKDTDFPTDERARLNNILTRLKSYEPLQYIIGETRFSGLPFEVTPSVLIPRPETEELVEQVILDNADQKIKILDIGTGSGCIAITLQIDMPESNVTAWDISADALDVARENAQQLGANVNFVKQDALNAKPEGEWDVIVSNPPYICEKEKKDMAVNVLEHEPHTALFVPDADPLLFYRAITRLAVQTLNKGGRLYFEINPIYADDTCRMMQAEGMTAVELRSDMYGKQRMAKGVKA